MIDEEKAEDRGKEDAERKARKRALWEERRDRRNAVVEAYLREEAEVRGFELPGTLCEGEPRVPTSLDDSKRYFISFILVEWLGFLGKKVLTEVEALTLLGFAFLDSRTS